MQKKWTLAHLEGVNPNTARLLFEEVSARYPSVTYRKFRQEIGNLACFDDDSRWINGDLFRDFFATRPAAGRYFVERYNAKLARRGEGASAYKSDRKSNTSPTRKGDKRTLSSIAREVADLTRKVERAERVKLDTMQAQREALRERLAQLEA